MSCSRHFCLLIFSSLTKHLALVLLINGQQGCLSVNRLSIAYYTCIMIYLQYRNWVGAGTLSWSNLFSVLMVDGQLFHTRPGYMYRVLDHEYLYPHCIPVTQWIHESIRFRNFPCHFHIGLPRQCHTKITWEDSSLYTWQRHPAGNCFHYFHMQM